MTTSKRNANAHLPIWEAVKLHGTVEVALHRELHAYLRHRLAHYKHRDHSYRLEHTSRNTGAKLYFESLLHEQDPAQDILRVSIRYTRSGAL